MCVCCRAGRRASVESVPARGALCRLSPQKSPLFTLALPTEAMPTVGGRVRSVGRLLGRILSILASDIQMRRLIQICMVQLSAILTHSVWYHSVFSMYTTVNEVLICWIQITEWKYIWLETLLLNIFFNIVVFNLEADWDCYMPQ